MNLAPAGTMSDVDNGARLITLRRELLRGLSPVSTGLDVMLRHRMAKPVVRLDGQP